MDKYELKELKILLQVLIDREAASTTDKEVYYKVLEEIGENEPYEHIAKVMEEKGWLKRLDKEMYLCHNSEGVRCYSSEPYYILTDKGIKGLGKKIKRYNRHAINWDRAISIVSLLKEGLVVVVRWFT